MIPNPFGRPERLLRERRPAVSQNLIHYRTHPDHADENQRLIEAVFAELSASGADGVRYAALRLPDATFYHLVMADDEAARARLTGLGAFRAFQAGLRQRCAEPPVSAPVVLVGGYRILGSP
jgi:hypothetical protein